MTPKPPVLTPMRAVNIEVTQADIERAIDGRWANSPTHCAICVAGERAFGRSVYTWFEVLQVVGFDTTVSLPHEVTQWQEDFVAYQDGRNVHRPKPITFEIQVPDNG